MLEPFSRESRPSIQGDIFTLFDAVLLGDELPVPKNGLPKNIQTPAQHSRVEEARLQLTERVLRIFELELRSLVRKQVSSDWFFRLLDWFREDIDTAISERMNEIRIQGNIPEIMIRTGARVRDLTSPIIEVLSKKGMEATIGYSQRITGQLAQSQEALNLQIAHLTETKDALEVERAQSAKNRERYDRSSQLLIKATRELTHARQSAKELSEQVRTLSENLELWKTASEAASAENDILRREHANEIAQLNERLGTSREQLSTVQADLESAQRTIESRNREIADLRLNLARAEDKAGLLEEEKAALDEMNQALIDQLEASEASYQDLLKMMPNKDLLVHQKNLVTALGEYFYVLLRKEGERRISDSVSQTDIHIRLE